MDQLLNEEYFSSLNYLRTFVGIAVLLINIFCLNFIYERYSRSNENKNDLKKNLPLFGLAIFLVISVIKTSLALSLGLVGALSIIRFRTAIKEPEQIINYLIVMAISISIAAEKELLSIIILFVYLIVYIYNSNKETSEKQTFISITVPFSESKNFDPISLLDMENGLSIVSISKSFQGDININLTSGKKILKSDLDLLMKNTKYSIDIY